MWHRYKAATFLQVLSFLTSDLTSITLSTLKTADFETINKSNSTLQTPTTIAMAELPDGIPVGGNINFTKAGKGTATYAMGGTFTRPGGNHTAITLQVLSPLSILHVLLRTYGGPSVSVYHQHH